MEGFGSAFFITFCGSIMLGEDVQRPNLSRNLTNYWNRSYRLVLCAAHVPRGPVLVYGPGPFAPCEACLAVRPWTGGTEYKEQGLPMEGFGSAFFILFCGFDHDRNGRAGKGGLRRRSYSHALVCAGTRGMRGGRQQGHQRRPSPRPPGWHKRRRGATLVAHAGPIFQVSGGPQGPGNGNRGHTGARERTGRGHGGLASGAFSKW